MTTVPFTQQYNQLNSLCYDVIHNNIKKDVDLYRYKLGYHFSFDFTYMIFRNQTKSEIILHGPGIRLREYDLLLHYLWYIPVEEYLNIKNEIYNKFQIEIKREVESFENREYCILSYGDVEHDQFLTLMTKYFQIYVVQNMDILNYDFNHYYNQSNQSTNTPYREP
jgi:hypothetical protein